MGLLPLKFIYCFRSPCWSVKHARRPVLEEKTEALAMNHDTFSRNTRNQLKQVFDALRELMTPPDPPKRPIGFVTADDKSKKAKD